MTTGFYAGLLALMLLILILRVVRLRWRFKVSIGDGGIRELEQAIRVHGNFIETAPMVLILMGLIEFGGAPHWAIHAFGIILVAGRALHAYGLSCNAGTSFGRLLGMVLTNSVLLVAGVTAMVQFIS